MKVRIGTHWAWDGVTVERFLGLMRELAQAVNGRMELMLDGNQRLTEDQALTITGSWQGWVLPGLRSRSRWLTLMGMPV